MTQICSKGPKKARIHINRNSSLHILDTDISLMVLDPLLQEFHIQGADSRTIYGRP